MYTIVSLCYWHCILSPTRNKIYLVHVELKNNKNPHFHLNKNAYAWTSSKFLYNYYSASTYTLVQLSFPYASEPLLSCNRRSSGTPFPQVLMGTHIRTLWVHLDIQQLSDIWQQLHEISVITQINTIHDMQCKHTYLHKAYLKVHTAKYIFQVFCHVPFLVRNEASGYCTFIFWHIQTEKLLFSKVISIITKHNKNIMPSS